MKKYVLLLSLVAALPLLGASVEEKVFVQPFASKIAQEIVKKTGDAIASQEKLQPNLVTLHVGANIPSMANEGIETLSGYVAKLAKGMDVGATAIITAPASYSVVFTDGSRSDDAIYQQIDEVLSKLGSNNDASAIAQALNSLNGVNRATFVRREDKLLLVTDVAGLKVGEPIWRKSLEGVTQDYYHSEEEYLVAFKNAGLLCEEISRPSFSGMIKWKLYNDSLQDKKESLGAAYMDHNPVTIYHVVKQAA